MRYKRNVVSRISPEIPRIFKVLYFLRSAEFVLLDGEKVP